MYDITFVRHAQSEANAEGVFQGQFDTPLTEKGRQQAAQLGKYWYEKGITFDKIISSPLLRARETAEGIQEYLKIPLEFEPDWMERDTGNLSGIPHKQLDAIKTRPDFISLYEPIGETGESEWMLYLRAGRAIHDLLQNPPGRYVVVSHSAFLKKVMLVALGIPPQGDFRGIRFWINNTACTRFKYCTENNQWSLTTMNDQSHILEPNWRIFERQYTFLRHAKPEDRGTKHSYHGRSEDPLDEHGLAQTQALIERWQSEKVTYDKIITSPQASAVQTAQIIKEKLNVPLEQDPRLKEIDLGKFTPPPQSEQPNTQFPPQFDLKTPYWAVGESGESWWELYLRTGQALDGLVHQPAGSYLVVSHAGTLNAMMYAILGIPPRSFKQTPLFNFDYATYATFGHRPSNDTWYITRIGDDWHLRKNID